ncbi:MAG: peptide-methionine (S)-S-oxide reductase, partial [Oscillospiraceae bacterium]|nr:peptide-methionine (S)-S-oxide reductase [Oscillospiraceae bacterium]
ANGDTENPSYEDVIAGAGHAETVHIQYDPDIVSLKALTKQFFKIINPLNINKQSNDVGVQYRTGAYYTDEADKQALRLVLSRTIYELVKCLQISV